MGFFTDTQTCGLCMHQECQERFPRHRLQRKPLVSDPRMHHGGGGKRSRHSRRMRNPQFCVPGKRPIEAMACKPPQ